MPSVATHAASEGLGRGMSMGAMIASRIDKNCSLIALAICLRGQAGLDDAVLRSNADAHH